MGMDHYVKIKEFGGVSGAILAKDKQDPNKKVVIKRVADGAQGMEELGASLRARHPNIAQFVESFVSDGSLYVVVRYEPGGDLDSLLSRLVRLGKAPTTQTLLMWYVQMLDALAYCHENKIIHRDVKPSNIFLSADTKTLYLGDFGSAKTLSAGNVTTTFVGSPMWISPEVLLGTPYSYSSDVWSMGCVFYEMAALRRPFAAPNFARLVQQITAGQIHPLPDFVDPPVRSIITAMLVVDPEKRPAASEMLLTAQREYTAERQRVEAAKARRRAGETKRQPAPGKASPSAAQLEQPPRPASPARGSPAERGGGTPPPPTAATTAPPPASGDFVDPQQYQRPRAHSREAAGGGGGAADVRSNSASQAVGTPDLLAGSMYGNAAVAAAIREANSPKQKSPPPPAQREADAPAAAAADEAQDREAVSSVHSYDRSLTLSQPDDKAEAAEEAAAPHPEAACGKPVAMFVAITPRGPRKNKPTGPVKKKRPPQVAPRKQAKAPAQSSPSPKPLSRQATPSPVPSAQKSPAAASIQSATPPAAALAAAKTPADVRTFSPQQLNIQGSTAVAAVAAPRYKRGAASAAPPQQLGGLQRTTTAPASTPRTDVAHSSVRLRSSTLTENPSESSASYTNRAGNGNESSGRRDSAGAQQTARPTKPQPPPPQVPRRVLAAAMEHGGSPQRQHPSPPIAKKRPPPTKAGAQPLAGLHQQPGVLQQRLAALSARGNAPRDSDVSSTDASTGPAPEEMRKSQWIRAKREDVSDIESYLLQFRGHDEELLYSYDAHAGQGNAQAANASTTSRRRSLVSLSGGGTSPARRGVSQQRRKPSPEAKRPPPAPPQQLQRGVTKSGSNGNKKTAVGAAMLGNKHVVSPERLRRLNSSVSNLNSTTNSLGYRAGARQASNARASQPRSAEELQRLEEERRLAREKREAEREQMAEMIRERREQQKKQRKQKKKADPFDVEVALPGQS